jgi:hypothetical protein
VYTKAEPRTLFRQLSPTRHKASIAAWTEKMWMAVETSMKQKNKMDKHKMSPSSPAAKLAQ